MARSRGIYVIVPDVEHADVHAGLYKLPKDSKAYLSPDTEYTGPVVVKGTSFSGVQVRNKCSNYHAAMFHRSNLEHQDVQFRKGVAEKAPEMHILKSSVITQPLLEDVEVAYTFLPILRDEIGDPILDTDGKHIIDPAAKISNIVEWAMANHYPIPTRSSHKKLREFRERMEKYRESLWLGRVTDVAQISEETYTSSRWRLGKFFDEYADIPVNLIAGSAWCKDQIKEKSEQSDEFCQAHAYKWYQTSGMVRQWLLNNGIVNKLGYFKVKAPIPTDISIHSLEEVQDILDAGYAAGLYLSTALKLQCAIRPSECRHNKAILDQDMTEYIIPDPEWLPTGKGDCTKTGYRPVEIPPCVRVVCMYLQDRGLLDGGAQPGEKYDNLVRGMAGFPISNQALYLWSSKILRYSKWETFCEIKDEVLKEFRRIYPKKYDEYEPDTARHTGGTYHWTIGRNIGATVTYMGNGANGWDVFEKHYRAKGISKEKAAVFYRLIPRQLWDVIYVDKIELPSWGQQFLKPSEIRYLIKV